MKYWTNFYKLGFQKITKNTHCFSWEKVRGAGCKSKPSRRKGGLLNHLVKGQEVNSSGLKNRRSDSDFESQKVEEMSETYGFEGSGSAKANRRELGSLPLAFALPDPSKP